MELEHRSWSEENFAVGEFLLEVSREFSTHLSAIAGYADLLLYIETAGTLTEKQREWLQGIHKSHQHVKRVIDRIFALSLVEAGEVPLRRARVTAAVTLDVAAALTAPQSEARAVELVLEVVCESDAAYEGDEDRVRELLVNLLSVAITRAGPGESVRVQLARAETARETALEGGSWITFTVDVFDPEVNSIYVCGHPRRRLQPPAVDRRFARLMQGDLTVRHTQDTASFTLWLPAVTE